MTIKNVLARDAKLAAMTPEAYLAQSNVRVAIDPVTAIQYELVGALMEQRGDLGIVVTVLREDGSPSVGDPFVINQFPDGHGDDPRNPDGSGIVSFSGASTSSAYTPPNRGPFTVSLVSGNVYKDPDTKMIHFDNLISPAIQGLGDYLGQHTRWYLQFRKKGAVVVVPPPPPPPPSGVPVIASDDELRNLGYSITGISYNPSAALTTFARSKGLGTALHSESRFIDEHGVKWAWQPFVLGIVKCVDGDWGNCKVVVW